MLFPICLGDALPTLLALVILPTAPDIMHPKLGDGDIAVTDDASFGFFFTFHNEYTLKQWTY